MPTRGGWLKSGGKFAGPFFVTNHSQSITPFTTTPRVEGREGGGLGVDKGRREMPPALNFSNWTGSVGGEGEKVESAATETRKVVEHYRGGSSFGSGGGIEQ